MKVTVNDQLIIRPRLLKPIEPGFQNLGKDVKINNRGQLVTRSAKAKELKKSFGIERGFKDLGYQNVDLNDRSSNFSNIGLKDEKELKLEFQNIVQNAKGKRTVTPPGQTVSQDVGQKGRSVNTLA